MSVPILKALMPLSLPLSLAERSILTALAWFARHPRENANGTVWGEDDEGIAWPSVATIARATSSNRTTVQRALRKLVAHGLLIDEGLHETASVRRWRVDIAACERLAAENPHSGVAPPPLLHSAAPLRRSAAPPAAQRPDGGCTAPPDLLVNNDPINEERQVNRNDSDESFASRDVPLDEGSLPASKTAPGKDRMAITIPDGLPSSEATRFAYLLGQLRVTIADGTIETRLTEAERQLSALLARLPK